MGHHRGGTNAKQAANEKIRTSNWISMETSGVTSRKISESIDRNPTNIQMKYVRLARRSAKVKNKGRRVDRDTTISQLVNYSCALNPSLVLDHFGKLMINID